jgi:alpha-D-ribose 1-methylphosphonate 5-triphosphate diphosphatase
MLPFAQAWALVSQAPANAVRLTDRGDIASGRRADLIIVDASTAKQPQVVATIVAGRIVHLARADIIVFAR